MVIPVTWHASAPRHPARVELASIVVRKVTTRRNAPMNALPVHSVALVVSAKWKGIVRETARPSQLTNAVTAARKVGWCSTMLPQVVISSYKKLQVISRRNVKTHTPSIGLA